MAQQAVSPEKLAVRATKVAWTSVAVGAAVVGVRVAQGCWPDQPVNHWALIEEARSFPDEVCNALIGLHAAYAIFVLLLGSRALFALLGHRRLGRHAAEQSVALTSLEADERSDRALARLIEFGYSVGPREPRDDGAWCIRATRASLG